MGKKVKMSWCKTTWYPFENNTGIVRVYNWQKLEKVLDMVWDSWFELVSIEYTQHNWIITLSIK